LPAPSLGLPSVAEITGRWDDLVERFRAAQKSMLMSALSHSSPASVSSSGLMTIALDEPNDIYEKALSSGAAEILTQLRTWFPSLSRVEVKKTERSAGSEPKRLTHEMLRADRIAILRKRDPVLSAAIDALDLDVTD
jgi:hypothetical protein